MSGLNRCQEGTTLALDIKAAFDRVWHKGLLVKLVANGVGRAAVTVVIQLLDGQTYPGSG